MEKKNKNQKLSLCKCLYISKDSEESFNNSGVDSHSYYLQKKKEKENKIRKSVYGLFSVFNFFRKYKMGVVS